MSEDPMDETLARLAREGYHRPPEPPREEMWAAIRAARGDELARRRLARERRWAPWAAGIAAALLLGVGLGRLSVRPGDPVTLPVAVAPAPAPEPAVAYQVAATQHLSRAEALLTSFRSEARSGRVDEEVSAWARDLLSNTRLMLDSPAAEDPQLRLLLEELELILAQISGLPQQGPAAETRQEVEIVRQAIEDGGVIPKLRTAIPAGAPQMATEE